MARPGREKQCAVCGVTVPNLQGLYNSHAIVCSWTCASEFNRRGNTNYAWLRRGALRNG